jgi:hypothetical protein
MKYLCASLILLIGAVSSPAASSINVGNHSLLPNTPGQTIAIYVTGGDLIAAADLLIQIGDGGPERVNFPPLLAGTDAPGVPLPVGLPNANLQNPTFGTDAGIFASVPNGGQSDGLGGSIPQLIGLSILTDTGTVAANGLLATLMIDTTGLTSGTWDLMLKDTLAGNTQFLDETANQVPLTIVNGRLTIVPEPTAIVPFAATSLALFALRRRAKHAQTARDANHFCAMM